jgi:hypothetical protein
MAWKTRLTAAIRAEVAADKAAVTAEDERRAAWWETTWALADVPRPEWSEAQTEYVTRTKHNKFTADKRRRAGARLTQTALAGCLPLPRFALEASDWIGKGGEAKVAEAVKLLADAEADDMSLREFHTMLTGTSWTSTPENLTEAEEDAIAVKVIKRRPQRVLPEAPAKAVRQQDQENARREIKADKQRAFEEEGYTAEEIEDDEREMAEITGAFQELSDLAEDMDEPEVLSMLRRIKIRYARALITVRRDGVTEEWRDSFRDILTELSEFHAALSSAVLNPQELAEATVIRIEDWLRQQSS